MSEALARARAAEDLIWLGVWERNARAIAFYGAGLLRDRTTDLPIERVIRSGTCSGATARTLIDSPMQGRFLM